MKKQRTVLTKSYTHDDEYYYKIIRKNIKSYRQNLKYTQQDLADMTSMSREYICDIENDSRNKHVTIAVLGRIAEALNIPIEDFFKKNTHKEWFFTFTST